MCPGVFRYSITTSPTPGSDIRRCAISVIPSPTSGATVAIYAPFPESGSMEEIPGTARSTSRGFSPFPATRCIRSLKTTILSLDHDRTVPAAATPGLLRSAASSGLFMGSRGVFERTRIKGPPPGTDRRSSESRSFPSEVSPYRGTIAIRSRRGVYAYRLPPRTS